MVAQFFVPDDDLAYLSSTQAGRISHAGFSYQFAYVALRLASMITPESESSQQGYPIALRHDWADDLDEVLNNGKVCFTQCKKVDDIGEPAKLAGVLLGFAPKWLWSPPENRPHIIFRLISCDARFIHSNFLVDRRAQTLTAFKAKLASAPTVNSDRSKWQLAANEVGHDELFKAIWETLSACYVDSKLVNNQPAGTMFRAEEIAMKELVMGLLVDAKKQKDALASLRCLINSNLIEFQPQIEHLCTFQDQKPKVLFASDVKLALFSCAISVAPQQFTVVNQSFLDAARAKPKKPFVFAPPEWRHVVHGTDDSVKFFERDQTEALCDEIRKKLLTAVSEGTSNLPVLFVTGSPGSGKSTLVRRAASLMVERREAVVIDAGLNLDDAPSDVGTYLAEIRRVAEAGHTVLLVLDDPLFEGSDWIALLKQLKATQAPVAVLAATPDFLYRKYKAQLVRLSVSDFFVAKPSADERRRISSIYKRPENSFGTAGDDLLVLIAQAESGTAFSTIMERLWSTLNRNKPFNPDETFTNLSWEVRAFCFVCYLHRWRGFCPVPILIAALELSGGTANTRSVGEELDALRSGAGWHIFSVRTAPEKNDRYEGDLIASAHQRIADAAWTKRPDTCAESWVMEYLVNASVTAPQSLRRLAATAAVMATDDNFANQTFLFSLNVKWAREAADNPDLETRYLCELIDYSRTIETNALASLWNAPLRARMIGDDGWLAASQLARLNSWMQDKQLIRSQTEIYQLIHIANFSRAPALAIKFFDQIVDDNRARTAVCDRLYAILSDQVDGKIDKHCLMWLVGGATRRKDLTPKRIFHIVKWLDENAGDTQVRVKFLDCLIALPKKLLIFQSARGRAAEHTGAWLADPAHRSDTAVRAKFLDFIAKLGGKFSDLQKQTATTTEKWLADERHTDDTAVRTQYMSYLCNVAGSFSEERRTALRDTGVWLTNHLDYEKASVVWTKYLSFVREVPEGGKINHSILAQAAANWLVQFPRKQDVVAGYLKFLLKLPSDQARNLQNASVNYHEWLIEVDPGNDGHIFDFAEQLLRLDKPDLNCNDGHERVRLGRAWALVKQGHATDGEAGIRAAMQLAKTKNAPLAIFHTCLGDLYLERKCWREAVDEFTQANGSRSSLLWRNFYGLARAYIGLNQTNEAEASLREALLIRHLSPEEESTLSELLARVRGGYGKKT